MCLNSKEKLESLQKHFDENKNKKDLSIHDRFFYFSSRKEILLPATAEENLVLVKNWGKQFKKFSRNMKWMPLAS